MGRLSNGSGRSQGREGFGATIHGVPTLEALAAVTSLRSDVPDIRVRFVNVVDQMVLQGPSSIRVEPDTHNSWS